jgi:iron-sulfur cluster repair protein YtfE (RIC family)
MTEKQPLVDTFTSIHKALRNGLTSYEATLYRVNQISPTDATKLRKWFELYWSMLEMHHKSEDTYFYNIFAQYDPTFRQHMDGLNTEHLEIDEYVEKIRAAFDRLPAAGSGTQPETTAHEIRQLITSFNRHLANHLKKEESIIFPLMHNYIPPKEQRTIDFKYQKSLPLKTVTLLVPWLMDNMPEQEGAALIKSAPFILGLLYRLSWKKKYNTLVATFQV